MLGGLLGQGFGSKCKSLSKMTKTRIEALRRRAEAKQRFLKEDLAKLLTNGLDINAYGRTEDFLAGLRLLCCYDFIEHYCDYILKNLSTMQKQRECPEVCREVVSSLMFAAARFSDLPELRDLRDAFQERYGNSIEHSVNQMFVDTLASKPPTIEKRLQLLRDIASEFSIKWDSRGFEQRMANPSAFVQDQCKKYGPSHVTTDKCKFSNGKDTDSKADKRDVISKERGNFVKDGQTMRNGKEGSVFRREEVDINFIRRQEKTGNGNNLLMITGEKRDDNDVSYRGRQELNEEKHRSSSKRKEDSAPTARSGSSSHGKSIDDIYAMKNGRENPIPKEERHDSLFRGKSEVAASCARLPDSGNGKGGSSVGNERESRQNVGNSTKKVQGEEADKLNSYFNSPRPPPYVKLKDNVIPPPYVKMKGSNGEAHTESKHTGFDVDCTSIDPSPRTKAIAVVNSHGNQKEQDNPHYEEGFGPTRVHGRGHEKDSCYQNSIPLPKPRSVRRKHSKSSSNHYDDGKLEDAGTVKRSSSSRRKEHSRKGLQVLFDDEHHKKDEEERMMDKLLLHYSKKASTYDVGKLRKKSQAHASNQMDADGSEQTGPDVNPEMVPPTRSNSLPHEQTAPSEPIKVYARANSFQPDNQARHVHPKLPDYDDLAARFAALRGR